MALNSLEIIRESELAASKKISEAQATAQKNLQIAEISAKDKIAKAKADAKIILEHKSDKAYKKAEEIIISAQNSAKVEASRLEQDALKKQDLVNNEILQILM